VQSENFLGEFQQQQFGKTVISRVSDIKQRHFGHGWKAYEIVYNFIIDNFLDSDDKVVKNRE
jgi:hypothetical protein